VKGTPILVEEMGYQDLNSYWNENWKEFSKDPGQFVDKVGDTLVEILKALEQMHEGCLFHGEVLKYKHKV
jgi:hypothetical protein